MSHIRITPFAEARDRAQVIVLWDAVFGYKDPHNDPALSIDKKIAVADGLFFVALAGEEVIGTIMAGYDGHRGWIYSLAVLPSHRRKGVASDLLVHAERALTANGCVKINLEILASNESVMKFYQTHGYAAEARICMGKRIAENIPVK